MFQIDIQQVCNTADDRIPRGIWRRPRSLQNILNPDSQSFLTQFQIFQQTLACDGGTAAFTLFCESLLGFFLLTEQRHPSGLSFPERLLCRGLAEHCLIDSPQTLFSFQFLTCKVPIKLIKLRTDFRQECLDGSNLRLQG